MRERRQEKLGWVVGWSGGFIWVWILSVVFFVQGKTMQAAIGLLIAIASAGAMFFFSPWRHPHTRYRRLMAPLYLLFLAAAAWVVWSFDDSRQAGIGSWWSVLLLLPVMIPLWTVGNRRWERRHA